jgi:pyruvate formate lyase activating enzyme
VVGGRLAPVLDTLVTLKSEGIWTEIVYLVVPTLNDDEQPINEMVKWILNELGPDVPLHFSRFYPKYKLLNLPPTPIPTLEKLRNIGLDGGMHYVYLGNVPGHAGENTVCPKCQKTVVGRVGYQIIENHIVNGRCRFCNYPIPGVWE